MPSKPVNFQNGKIYKIASFQRYQNGEMNYISSYELLQYPDVDIILLENYPCNNKQELHARERHYIQLLDCVNKCIPTRTAKEAHQVYYQENCEKIKTQRKQHYQENRESPTTTATICTGASRGDQSLAKTILSR